MSSVALPDYAELCCRSNFSFLTGASHPEELVRAAAARGYRALALSDECSFAGLVRAHVAAREAGIALIAGTELVLEDGLRLVLLADDLTAYRAIAALITRGRRRAPKGRYVLNRDDVATLAHGLVVWLPAHDAVDDERAAWLARHFPARAWIGLGLFYAGDDAARLAHVRRLGAAGGLP
ncbi:MAG: PHP domain-containing protein, partial [Gammaproteobacteria bacterium]